MINVYMDISSKVYLMAMALTLTALMVIGCETNEKLVNTIYMYSTGTDEIITVNLYKIGPYPDNVPSDSDIVLDKFTIEKKTKSGNTTKLTIRLKEPGFFWGYTRLTGKYLIICCPYIHTHSSSIFVFDLSDDSIREGRSFIVPGTVLVTSTNKEYLTYNDDNHGLFILNIKDGSVNRISENAYAHYPTWNSSGDYLLYAEKIDNKYPLIEYHPSSREHTRRNTISIDRPTWMYLSPNDEYLIFAGYDDVDRNGSSDIYVVNMSNNKTLHISTPEPTILAPSPWSLDSKQVLLGYGGANYVDGVMLYDIRKKKVCYKRHIKGSSKVIAWNKLSDDVIVSKQGGSIWKFKLFSNDETRTFP